MKYVGYFCAVSCAFIAFVAGTPAERNAWAVAALFAFAYAAKS